MPVESMMGTKLGKICKSERFKFDGCLGASYTQDFRYLYCLMDQHQRKARSKPRAQARAHAQQQQQSQIQIQIPKEKCKLQLQNKF